MLDVARTQLVQLGAELRLARVRSGRSQSDVGERTGLSQKRIERIEVGLGGRMEDYLAVARDLDLRLSAVYPGRPGDGDSAEATTVEDQDEDDGKYLKILLDNLFSYVALLDVDGVVQEVNQAPLVRAGYRYEDVIGQYFFDAPWWSYDSAVQGQLKDAIEGARHGKISRYDVVVKMGNELTPIDFQISPAYDRKGKMFGLLATAVDITERKRIEEERNLVNELAYSDMLTGLPNRRLFHDRLEQEIRKSEHSGNSVVLILIDLDRFKEINDSLGHEIGDSLLREAADRLCGCLRSYDTVARMGGDEFAVILSGVDNFSDVQRIAKDIIDVLSRKYVISEKSIFASASAGLSVYPVDATDSSTLIRYADQAMYRAKADGRHRFNYFTKDMQVAAERRVRLATELRSALPRHQFMVYYQPIVELAGGRIEKAEALLRWQHPQYGFIPPDAFISIAEETGLIHEIGDWVFDQAAREAKRLCEIAGSNFQVSVNSSPVQFRRRGEGHDLWLTKLKEIGIRGPNIVVEITESLMMNHDDSVANTLSKFRDAGVEFAIDDFGTGYSALSYLNRFDIDYLKIDKSFVRNLSLGSPDVTLSEAIVVMAHKLGITVIAEGVETDEECTILRDIGCDYGQGYLFSPPVPAEVFEELLAKNDGRFPAVSPSAPRAEPA
ncbi:MAG: EAL domain-containing protein [Mycobacterium sp.]|nr:EAL domain-containing protein [Mycobacterium sp.]